MPSPRSLLASGRVPLSLRLVPRPHPALLVAGASLVGLAGCPEPGPPPPDGGAPSSATVLVYEPVAGAMDFGVMPFPDDLYLEGGHVELGALPSEAGAFADYAETARAALRELDGFGATTPIYFPVAGALDPASLPSSPTGSTLEDASVFLVDVDTASPAATERVPVEVRFDAGRGLLVLRPWTGHPLHEGRTYAAVVTRGVRGADGLPLSPSPRFAGIRDAATRPTDALAAEAWNEVQPVISTLGLPPERVAGMAVFTVQTIDRGLTEARAVVRGSAPSALTIDRVASGAALDALLGTPVIDQAGLDIEGGVQHSHLGWVIDGSFEAPGFLDETAMVHGSFGHGTDGALEVRRIDRVPFTVTLPAGDVSSTRVVVFQHGLGGERSSLFSIADALAAEGWAVAAIDIPFHGMRAGADPSLLDTRHQFGSSLGPDLYGEVGGSTVYLGFVGAYDSMGDLSVFHPFYVRDVLRQSVADLMGLVHQLDAGDWSVVAAAGGPAGLAFSTQPMGFVGVSLGGIIGTEFVTTEPRIGAAVLNVTGGILTALVGGSAAFNGTFLPILAPRIGLDTDAIDYAALPPEFLPELAIYQTLLDAGDSMAYAPLLAVRERHLLFQMALDDEVVPNAATEGLAHASGAPIAGATPRFTDLPSTTFPVAGNVRVGSAMFTRALTVFAPATHGLLSRRSDVHERVHPVVWPFETLAAPVPVANPVDAAVEQAIRFFATWEVGAAEIAAPL